MDGFSSVNAQWCHLHMLFTLFLFFCLHVEEYGVLYAHKAQNILSWDWLQASYKQTIPGYKRTVKTPMETSDPKWSWTGNCCRRMKEDRQQTEWLALETLHMALKRSRFRGSYCTRLVVKKALTFWTLWVNFLYQHFLHLELKKKKKSLHLCWAQMEQITKYLVTMFFLKLCTNSAWFPHTISVDYQRML